MRLILFFLLVSLSTVHAAEPPWLVNIGSAGNDRQGDPLRTAFTKVNANFTNLWNSNLGFLPDPDAARSTLRAATHVSTVSDLLALPGSGRTNIVFVLGRNFNTDQGGGLFAWIAGASATTNTGTIFAATGGQWQRITEGGPLNVRWFGAQGDGVTDDTAAIQAAIDLAVDSGQWGHVHLPDGIYRTTATLTVSKGIRISGAMMVGGTSYDPMTYRGTMIRYDGTTGSAIQIGGTGSFVYRPEIEHLRLGTSGQSVKPDGIVMEMVSEAKVSHVQVNGGFKNGVLLKNVTLTHFSKLECLANEVGILVENDSTGGMLQECSFESLNFFLHSVAAVHFKGSARNILFHGRSWFEFQPIAFLIERGSTFTSIDKITIMDSTVSNGGTNYVESRAVKVDAKSGADIGFVFRGLSIKNSLFYNNQASYAIELAFTNNTHINTVARGIEIDGSNFYGIQTAAVYSDWNNAEITFKGTILALTGFLGGSEIPENAGFGRINKAITRFDYTDFYEGQIWRLPTVGPSAFLVGHFGWNTTHLKPYWHDGVSVKYAAAVDDGNKLLVDGATLTSGALILSGTGTPEGAVTAPVGSLFLRTAGGAGTSFYIKESGTGNTGWVAK